MFESRKLITINNSCETKPFIEHGNIDDFRKFDDQQ